jgi:predicted amidohydrolase
MKRAVGLLSLGLVLAAAWGCWAAPGDTKVAVDQGKQGVTKEPEMTKEQEIMSKKPRKVIVGTCVFGMWGEFPGFDQRLAQLGGLVDEMDKKAKDKYGADAHLDLAVLPEYGVTSGKGGDAKERCVPLQGKVLDYFGAKAKEHKTYLVVAMELADDAAHGGCTNAAALIDREGKLVGIYRKVHAVTHMGGKNLEGGMAPGTEVPVFDCDFGKLGIQICFDMEYDDGWQTLADKRAELVAWPTQSPATIQTASRALAHRYYIVSSTWRDNASLFDPTGATIAQISKPEDRVLAERVDLSYAVLPWQSKLQDGKAFTAKYGDKAGYRYSAREDRGIFWSNDPTKSIGEMVKELGMATDGQLLDYNTKLRDKLAGELPK